MKASDLFHSVSEVPFIAEPLSACSFLGAFLFGRTGQEPSEIFLYSPASGHPS